jgi:hypothetical protein
MHGGPVYANVRRAKASLVRALYIPPCQSQSRFKESALALIPASNGLLHHGPGGSFDQVSRGSSLRRCGYPLFEGAASVVPPPSCAPVSRSPFDSRAERGKR